MTRSPGPHTAVVSLTTMAAPAAIASIVTSTRISNRDGTTTTSKLASSFGISLVFAKPWNLTRLIDTELVSQRSQIGHHRPVADHCQ